MAKPIVKSSSPTFASITAQKPAKKPSLNKVQALIRGYLLRCKWVQVKENQIEYKREMFYRRQAEKHAQMYMTKPIVTAKSVPTVTKPAPVAQKELVKDIEYYLREFRLDASVKGKLFDYGVGVLEDLDDMELEDIDDLELKPMEKKRFTKLLRCVKSLL